MKGPLQRTKVVIRHLPPSLSQSDLFSQIDHRFRDRYCWFTFRPGKTSHRQQKYARAYINFNSPDDVIEFAEFLDGHVFVNEKGTQYKAIVEYAPSQRVPRPCTKPDARDGTIYKDSDYLDFLKLIAKPAENLPSAEIQLERKEAEQSGIGKKTNVVTPLMEFVRQKRAESGSQGLSVVGSVTIRSGMHSSHKLGSSSTKRHSKKKKYVLKESTQKTIKKNNLGSRSDQQVTSGGKEIFENDTVTGSSNSFPGINLTTEAGKKNIVLLKKEREPVPKPPTMSEKPTETSSIGNPPVSLARRQNQTREASGRLIRSILLNNESRQSQSSTSVPPRQKTQIVNSENGKRPPASGNPVSGSYRYAGRGVATQHMRGDGSVMNEVKSSKRGAGSSSNTNDKQKWVQKSSSGS